MWRCFFFLFLFPSSVFFSLFFFFLSREYWHRVSFGVLRTCAPLFPTAACVCLCPAHTLTAHHIYGRTAFIVTRFISLLCAVHFVSCFVHRLHRNNEMKRRRKKSSTENSKNKKLHARTTGTGEILAKMRCERKFLAVRMEHFWCVMRPASVANIRWH